jgi:hypothetical protein
MAPRPSSSRQVRLSDKPEARKIEAISGPTMRPAAWLANTAPTIRPRVFLPAYSLMIVADTG